MTAASPRGQPILPHVSRPIYPAPSTLPLALHNLHCLLLVVGGRAVRLVRIAWELVEQAHVKGSKLRAREAIHIRSEVLVDQVRDWRQVVENVVQGVRDALLK